MICPSCREPMAETDIMAEILWDGKLTFKGKTGVTTKALNQGFSISKAFGAEHLEPLEIKGFGNTDKGR